MWNPRKQKKRLCMKNIDVPQRQYAVKKNPQRGEGWPGERGVNNKIHHVRFQESGRRSATLRDLQKATGFGLANIKSGSVQQSKLPEARNTGKHAITRYQTWWPLKIGGARYFRQDVQFRIEEGERPVLGKKRRAA